MTEENGMGFETSTGFSNLSTKPSRKKKSSSKTPKETVAEVSAEKEVIEEVVEYEAPAPSAPTPPSPVAAPAPVNPWKPLVRPLRKSSSTTEPNRGEMRRTR